MSLCRADMFAPVRGPAPTDRRRGAALAFTGPRLCRSRRDVPARRSRGGWAPPASFSPDAGRPVLTGLAPAAPDSPVPDAAPGTCLNPLTPKDTDMTPDHTHAALQAEAQARWGDTPEWRAASERMKAYGPAEPAAIEADQLAAISALAARMREGLAPSGPAVQAEVEGWRRLTERWFHPCSDAQLARLADLYEADERFRAAFEAQAPGLGRFVIAAFRHGRAAGRGEGGT